MLYPPRFRDKIVIHTKLNKKEFLCHAKIICRADTPGTHHAAAEPQHEFRVTDDFGVFAALLAHALEIIYILEGSSIVTLSPHKDRPSGNISADQFRAYPHGAPSGSTRETASILMQIPDAFLGEPFGLIRHSSGSRLTTTVRIRSAEKYQPVPASFAFDDAAS